MIKIIRNIIGAACLLGTVSMQAQQLPSMSHYLYNPYLINPARTGQNDYGQFSLHFKKEWSDLPSSPLTGALTIEAPLSTKAGNMGLGGMVYVDQMHILTKIGGMGTYAYHITFAKNKDFKHQLSMGISAGFIHQRFNFPEATVENPNDNQLIPSEANGTAFDFSAGIDYHFKGLHIGASMLQGLNAGLKFYNIGAQDVQYVHTRHWMFSASYKFLIGPKEKKHRFYLEPAFLGRYIENVPFQAEGNLILGVDGIAWLGLGYRSSNNLSATAALHATIGVEVKRQFIFSYGFEAGIDPTFGIANTGTQHEFMVAYRFRKKDAQAKIEFPPQPNIDSIVNVINNRMDTMDVDIQNNTNTNAEQDEKHNQIKENTDKNSSGVETNRIEIERLKEMFKNQPTEFKKVGEVYFDQGSDKLSKEGKANLDAIKTAIDQIESKKDAIVHIYVKGNASTEGDAKRNMDLSMRRSIAARQYLVEIGMKGENLTIIPVGAEDPTDGVSEGAKSKDRRIDIIFTEKVPKGKL